jgi:hypothetical protein
MILLCWIVLPYYKRIIQFYNNFILHPNTFVVYFWRKALETENSKLFFFWQKKKICMTSKTNFYDWKKKNPWLKTKFRMTKKFFVYTTKPCMTSAWPKKTFCMTKKILDRQLALTDSQTHEVWRPLPRALMPYACWRPLPRALIHSFRWWEKTVNPFTGDFDLP